MRKSRVVAAVAAMAFFISGIGANNCVGTSNGTSNGTSPYGKPFCFTDPPIGCAAYCKDVGTVAFTDRCSAVDAGDRELAFEVALMQQVDAAIAQGYEVCPKADNTSYVTPCALGIPPVEHPNQDHEVCQTPPLDCSL